MPRASRIVLNEVDLTFGTSIPASGISGVECQLNYGPVARPDILITTVPQFNRIYGGIDPTNEASILCERALKRGSSLRINNIKHYTDITNPNSTSATKSAPGQTSKVIPGGLVGPGHTITVTIDGTPVSQLFAVSFANTLNLLAAKIKSTLPDLVEDAVNTENLSISITKIEGHADLVVTAAITGVGAPAVVVTNRSTGTNIGGTEVIKFTPKYPGVQGNALKQFVLPASNGDYNYFNLRFEVIGKPELSETYANIRIPGNPTAAQSNFFDEIIKRSQLVDPVYLNLSALVGQIIPEKTIFKYTGGSNGGAVVDADYIGDAGGKTGLFAFDAFDDISQIAILDSNSRNVHISGSAYAQTRQNLQYFWHIDNSFVTASTIAAERDAALIDSSFTMIFAGGLKIADPWTSNERNISAIGDILGVAAYAENKYGAHISFTGPRRGILMDALGVVNNFGAAGSYVDRNYLSEHQINVVSVADGKIQIQGNFTAAKAQSDYSYSNVKRMVISLKKRLGPVLNSFIEEPNDIQTWKQIYMAVHPTLVSLQEARAFYDFAWEGDQFAESMDNLQINTPDDVDQGKYKVSLFLKAIKSLQEIQIDITLTQSGVSFEEVLSLITNNNAA
jgi:hypothetical protein